MNKFTPLFIAVFSSVVFAEIDVVKDFDFSRCGYEQNASEVPLVPAVLKVDPISGDATALIQQAIDTVSTQPVGPNGFRGAVLLGEGTFNVSGSVVLSSSGVVLRGSGDEATILRATGISRRTLIEVEGPGDPVLGKQYKVTDELIVPGAKSLTLDSADGLSVGDTVLIERPSTAEWIDAIGMNAFKGLFLDKRLTWEPGSRNIVWDRTITEIVGNVVQIDNPITTEIDASLGQVTVTSYTWPNRIENVGVENLRCVSEFDSNNPKDEEHAWFCVHLKNFKNGWVRNLTAEQFVSSAVRLDPTVSQVTVEFCKSLNPVSEIGGRRRVSFYNGGQLNLFRNCYSENGRHDFVVGFCSAGPNVFKDCRADNAHRWSGSFESWACSALFDNVMVNGNSIRFSNVETYANGMGWTGSQCVMWNCDGAELDADNPPGSQNHIYSGRGSMVGDVEPDYPFRHNPVHSLFDEHLKARTDRRNLPVQAMRYAFGQQKAPTFIFDPSKIEAPEDLTVEQIEIINGRFVLDGKLFWSGHDGTDIWVGGMSNAHARQAGTSITRWAPGRDGSGYTDNLNEVAEGLLKGDRRMFAHRPNLWYDRRRMDHQWIARQDGDVVAPFYEMPWARTGEGTSWEGLSKFDLTKWNPWYFNRVDSFAELCDQKGILLYHEFYDNHWVIENGAHWVDCPWRPVNAIQDTGMTELPPFTQTPRNGNHFYIEIVDEFYDLSRPVNREMHRLYIRKCLESLKGRENVLHSVGFQYSGSLEFAKFFYDIVRDWQKENGTKLKLAICTAKNVTDGLLSDPKYADIIDVVDIRHWQYLTDGTLFAPKGGINMAYRQQRRYTFVESNGKVIPPSTEELLYNQVREYRDRYPDKAIVAYPAGAGSLPILMAGGAYVVHTNDGLHRSKLSAADHDLYKFINSQLGSDIWKMNPDEGVLKDSSQVWCLSEPGETYLIYSSKGDDFTATIDAGKYSFTWLTPLGQPITKIQVLKVGAKENEFHPPGNEPALLLIRKSK